MKIKELREKNSEELKKIFSEKQENILKLRFEVASKQVKGNRGLRNDRRTIAQILTLTNEKNGK